MPKFLEQKLVAEYGPNNPRAVFGTMNAIGAMKGNKETAEGRQMEAKHEAKAMHPAMVAHGRKVKAAHAHLAATSPRFRQALPAQRMQMVQNHIRRTK